MPVHVLCAGPPSLRQYSRDQNAVSPALLKRRSRPSQSTPTSSQVDELRTNEMGVSKLEAVADRDDVPFGDHLRRILVILGQKRQLENAVHKVLNGDGSISNEDFGRLRSHGVRVGESAQDVHPRCQLYATFLKRHLGKAPFAVPSL